MSSEEDYADFENNQHPSTTTDQYERSATSRYGGQAIKKSVSPNPKKKHPLLNRKDNQHSKAQLYHTQDDVFVEPSEMEKSIPATKPKATNYFLGGKRKPEPVSTSTAKSGIFGKDSEEKDLPKQPKRAVESQQDSQAVALAKTKNPVSAQEYKSLKAQVLGIKPSEVEAAETRNKIDKVVLPKIGPGLYRLSTVYLPSSESLYRNCKRSLELVDGTYSLRKTIDAIVERQPAVPSVVDHIHWNNNEGTDYLMLGAAKQPKSGASLPSAQNSEIDPRLWQEAFQATEIDSLDPRCYLECSPLNSEEFYEGLLKDFLKNTEQACEDLDVGTKTHLGERWTSYTPQQRASSPHRSPSVSELSKITPEQAANKLDKYFSPSPSKTKSLEDNSASSTTQKPGSLSDPTQTSAKTTTAPHQSAYFQTQHLPQISLTAQTYGENAIDALISLQIQTNYLDKKVAQISSATNNRNADSGCGSDEQTLKDTQTIAEFDSWLRKQGEEGLLVQTGRKSVGLVGLRNSLMVYRVRVLLRDRRSEWRTVDPVQIEQLLGGKNEGRLEFLGTDKLPEIVVSQEKNQDLQNSSWLLESKISQNFSENQNQANRLEWMLDNMPASISSFRYSGVLDSAPTTFENKLAQIDKLADEYLQRLDLDKYIAAKQLVDDMRSQNQYLSSLKLQEPMNQVEMFLQAAQTILHKPVQIDLTDKASQYEHKLRLPVSKVSNQTIDIVSDLKVYEHLQKQFLSKLKKDLKKQKDLKAASGIDGEASIQLGKRGNLELSSPELKLPEEEHKPEERTTQVQPAKHSFAKLIKHSNVALRFEFRNFSMPKELVRAGFKSDIRQVLRESGKFDSKTWTVVMMKRDDHSKLLKSKGITREPQHVYSYALENVDSSMYFPTYTQLSCTHPSAIILFEYTEQSPLVRSGIGMGSRLTKYFYPEKVADIIKRKFPASHSNQDKILGFRNLISQELGLYGEEVPLKPNTHLPTAGSLPQNSKRIGTTILENNMFLAPVASQKPCKNDFLLVRTVDSKGRTKYLLRKIKSIYTVGQTEPKEENFCPYTNRYRNFLRRMLIDRINFEFRKNKMIDVVSLAKNFPVMDINLLKKFIRTLGGDNRTKDNRYYTYSEAVIKDNLISGDLNFEDLEVTITPEEMCWFESMCYSNHKLTELGITKLKAVIDLAKVRNKFIRAHLEQPRECAVMQFIMDELSLTSWNLSQQYRAAIETRKRMVLGGLGDPTNGNGGISFLRGHYTGEITNPEPVTGTEMQSSPQPANKASSANSQSVPNLLQKDLRKIPLKSLNAWLSVKFSYSQEILNEMSRKDKLLAYKNFALGQAGSKDSKNQDVVENYKKQLKLNIKAQWQSYNQELNKRFEVQLENISNGNMATIASDDEEEQADGDDNTVKISEKRGSENNPEVLSKSTPSSSSTRQRLTSRSPPVKGRPRGTTRSPVTHQRLPVKKDYAQLEALRKEQELAKKTKELEAEILKLKEKLKEGDDVSQDEQEETPAAEDIPDLPAPLQAEQEDNIFAFETCDIEF